MNNKEDCKQQADRLRAFADEVEHGKVHAFALAVWNGYMLTGHHAGQSQSVVAFWENSAGDVPPTIIPLLGAVQVLQARLLQAQGEVTTRTPRRFASDPAEGHA